MIEFSIAETLPTVNVLKRLHWAKVRQIRQRVCRMVAEATIGKRPASPYTRCRVHIKRYSSQEPDVDAMPTTAKILLDVLQPVSKRCPNGLGIIENDNSACIMELKVEHVPKRIARTDVMIECC